MKRLEFYATEAGDVPFDNWLDGLDSATRAKIMAFINRVALGGSKKNVKPVGIGVYEIKIYHGPGYRVYFGMIGYVILLLLLGGDKNTQDKDIKLAKSYWRKVNVQR